jgi:predicted MPP superfamily phosphohydrolase
MAGLTWLHLSDWHQKEQSFDRKVVRDALIKDLRERAQRIDRSLERVDFVVFSGDLAFSGQKSEYSAAQEQLLGPVLDAVGLSPDRMFIVPGNHDLNRYAVDRYLPALLQSPFASGDKVVEWLVNARDRSIAMSPFDEYRNFVAGYTGQSTPEYASILRFKGDVEVALLGLNSAWMCGRHKNDGGEIDDARYLVVGEPQIHDALNQIADAAIRIAVIHHPFDWLAEFDREYIEDRLTRECHFVLHGHQHRPRVNIVDGTGGECVIIPAGASYDRRVAGNPRYTNGYNWVHLDIPGREGAVYLRKWSDPQNEWVADLDTYKDSKFVINPLPKHRGNEKGKSGRDDHYVPEVPPYWRIAQLLLRGEIVPFLGPGAAEFGRDEGNERAEDAFALAELLAREASFPRDEPPHARQDIWRVASYWARQNRQDLDAFLERLFQKRLNPGPLHRLFANNETPLLLVTTSFDNLIEHALDEAGREYDLVISRGYNVQHRSPEVSDLDGEIKAQDLGRHLPQKLTRPLIYKMSGGLEKDIPFCVTEEDHVRFLGIGNPIPPALCDIIRNKRLIFLGYGLKDWNFRVMLRTLHSSFSGSMADAWAIQRDVSAAERELWRSHGVKCFDLSELQLTFAEFAERLKQAADAEQVKEAGPAGKRGP